MMNINGNSYRFLLMIQTDMCTLERLFHIPHHKNVLFESNDEYKWWLIPFFTDDSNRYVYIVTFIPYLVIKINLIK